MKILLAVDGSPCSEAVLDEVVTRAWPRDSEFRIITVYELPLTPTPETWAMSTDYCTRLEQVVLEQTQGIARTAFAKLQSILGNSFKVTYVVAPGSPKGVILEEAEHWHADLILLGSHGYRTWERLLLGSVSQAVVAHASCSVEVVRCKSAPTKKTEAA